MFNHTTRQIEFLGKNGGPRFLQNNCGMRKLGLLHQKTGQVSLSEFGLHVEQINHPVKVSHLEIGHIGSLPISIPITTIGEGDPHIAILCGIHGDEITGLVISRHFLRELMKKNTLHGSVSIITAANPLAQATRTRVAVPDYLDLNRVGQGKSNGVFTERLAYTLCEFLSECTFFVDLHEFVMSTPTLAIYIPSSQREVDQLILQGIAAFSPSLVWAMNLAVPEEIKYSGSLLAALINHGTPGFAVETSRLVELSPETINQIVEGLIEITKLIGVTEGQPRISTPPAFVRKVMHSDQAGIWTPKATLLSLIQESEIIGGITSLDLIKDIPVFSHAEGTLIQLASSDLVDTGTSLFTIGVEDPNVTIKIQSIAVIGHNKAD